MRGTFSSNTLPQTIDLRARSVRPSAVLPTAVGCSMSSKQMQAATWNGNSVEDDAGSTDVVWNSEKGREIENRQGTMVSDGPMVSSLFLNFESEPKWERHDGLISEHLSGIPRLGVPCEASRISFLLSDILKLALSPAYGQESAEPGSVNLKGGVERFKRGRYGADLTEEERRAERNRKGRERSMRTRQRNAAHMKRLEDGCTRLITENRLLRDLLNCLQRVPLAEESVMSLLRSLLSPSRIPSAFHPAFEHVESFAAPSKSHAPLTHHKMISNVEYHDGSCDCDEVPQRSTLPGNETQVENTDSAKNADMSASVWEPEQILGSLPESSNVSKTSMTSRRIPEPRAEGIFESRFHASVDNSDETHEEDQPALANFSLDEIDAVICL